MKSPKIVSLAAFLLASSILFAQNYKLKNDSFEIQFSPTGTITSFRSNGENIEFRKDNKFEGPAIVFANNKVVLKNTKSNATDLIFSGETSEIGVTLSYSFENKAFAIKATIKNKTADDIPIDTLILRLGINTEMDAFPHWNQVYFPTMMRCEKDFFWGYLMNPGGRIITVTTRNPVASWNHSYKKGGHRIFTTNLDLMHNLPLPGRHPQNLHTLKSNEEKTWNIFLQPAHKLQDVKQIVSELSNAVLIDAQQYTIAENESFRISLRGSAKSLNIITPNNKNIKLKPLAFINFTPKDGVGKYKLEAVSESGKTTEAVFSVRKPWSWYMQQARINAIVNEQKGGSHAESWYGLFSMFLAQKYYPDSTLLKKSLDKFNEIYPLMYDKKGTPKSKILWGSWDITNRIQNTAVMASLLAAMYSTLHDTTYLVQASEMCDFLLSNQDGKGAYRNGKTHYTSVVYIAKSVLEVCEQEKLLATRNNIWQQRYNRHFKSAKNAIDELTLNRDNIETEGEMTYEDGMISCSYTQIAFLATLTQDSVERNKFIESAEYLRKGHQCLSQLLIPDARMNGGSLRYWESQYDILSFENMMSSPHGWTAWRIYGLYYLYQLTGNPELLDQMYNALGACVQLVDETSGELRWAFCVDPYLLGNPALNNPNKKFSHDQMKGGNLLVKDSMFSERENRGVRINKPVGEQYVNMISGWYKAKPHTWVTGYWEPDGGSCDNDVHEIFKCLEETALTNAFVVEQNDGSFRAYNCKIKTNGNLIDITPYEEMVNRVNVNLKHNAVVTIYFKNKPVNEQVIGGKMKWIGPARMN
jgi:hypothetical protein